MAPMKQPKSTAKSRDQLRKMNTDSVSNDMGEIGMFYKCNYELCDTRCDHTLESPIRRSDRLADQNLKRENEEMDAYYSGDDENPNTRMLLGRKNINSAQPSSKMALKTGMEITIRHLSQALDFGIQTGFLEPKDTKGQLIRVNSDLLAENVPEGGEQKDSPVRVRTTAGIKRTPKRGVRKISSRRTTRSRSKTRRVPGVKRKTTAGSRCQVRRRPTKLEQELNKQTKSENSGQQDEMFGNNESISGNNNDENNNNNNYDEDENVFVKTEEFTSTFQNANEEDTNIEVFDGH